MARELLDSTSVVITQREALELVAEKNGGSVQEIISAGGLLAIGVASTILINPILGAIAASTGIATGLDGFLDEVEKALDPDELTNCIERLSGSLDDQILVESNYYKWTSSNGNVSTKYVEIDYDVIYM